MNLFEGRNMAQFCERCKGVMLGDTPRQIIDGKVYHLSCGWQLEREALRKISDQLGGDDADPISERSGGDATLPSQRAESSALDTKSTVQSNPIPLHWTSHQ